jgi:ubiquinone/menaquinone biosynthesis C-methylase UbiE
MAAEYDAIAREYRASKQLAFREHVEQHLLRQLLAHSAPRGAKVLDLACGEGIWARLVAQQLGAHVVGVDLSAAMVQLARESEAAEPLGCVFEVGDCAELALDGEGTYDVVMAVWLLNYAKSEQQLEAFARTAYRFLKPGGVLVGFNNNPSNPVARFATYAKYGFVKEAEPLREPEPQQAGDRIIYHITNPLTNSSFQVDNYFLAVDAHDRAFKAAGFPLGLAWLELDVSPEGRRAFPDGFWNGLLHGADAPFKAITARKPELHAPALNGIA